MPKIMNSKKPFDSILAILATVKAALGKAAQKITLFVIERPIQKMVMKGNLNKGRYFKSLGIEN